MCVCVCVCVCVCADGGAGGPRRLPDLVVFAREHGLPLVSIEQLCQYLDDDEGLVR